MKHLLCFNTGQHTFHNTSWYKRHLPLLIVECVKVTICNFHRPIDLENKYTIEPTVDLTIFREGLVGGGLATFGESLLSGFINGRNVLTLLSGGGGGRYFRTFSES